MVTSVRILVSDVQAQPQHLGASCRAGGHKWTCKDGTLVGRHCNTEQQLLQRLQTL